MRRLACLSLALSSLVFAGPKEVRFYDVGALTSSIPDYPGDALGVKGDPSAVADTGCGSAPYTYDEVVSLLKTHVSPETWDGKDNEIEAVGGGLCVRAPAEVQDQVARALADLAQGIGTQIELRVRRVRVSADLLRRLAPEGPIALDDARLKALTEALAARTEAALDSDERLVAFPGQRVHVKDAASVNYVCAYDTEIAQHAAIATPIPGEVQEGTLVDVRPSLAPDASTILLECRVRSASLLSLETFASDTQLIGVLQLPCVASSSLCTCLAAPNGATILAGWRSLPTEQQDKRLRYECVLIAASRMGGAAEAPAKEGAKPLRVIDLGVLARTIPDFPGPAVSLPRHGPEVVPATGATFQIGPVPGAAENAPDLLTLLSRSVAPGTWTLDNCLEMTSSGRLLARNSPEAMAQLDAFLGKLTRPMLRTVSIGATYLSLSPSAYAELSKEGQPLGGGALSLTADQASALLARAQAEQGARELGSGWISGLPGERVSLTTLRSQSYVSDFTAQVATEAKIAQPIVGVATTGYILDVRPQALPDGRSLLLDLRPTLAEAAGPTETLDVKSADIGKIHLPKVRTQETRTTLTIANGGWAVMGMSTRSSEEGPQEVVLLVHASCAGAK